MKSDEDFILKDIFITKSDTNYGFCIKGGRKKSLGIFITDVVNNSSAQLSGLLINDQILKVNDKDFTNLKIDLALDYLQQSQSINIKIKRSINDIKSNQHYIELERSRTNQSFGFLVDNSKNGTVYSNRLFLKSIENDSLAYHANLKPGDEIIQINNKLIKATDCNELSNIFKQALKLNMLIDSVYESLNNANNIFKSVRFLSNNKRNKLDNMINDLSDSESNDSKNRTHLRRTSQIYEKCQKTKLKKLDSSVIIDKTFNLKQSDDQIQYLINHLDDESNLNADEDLPNNELFLSDEISYQPNQLNIETDAISEDIEFVNKCIDESEQRLNEASLTPLIYSAYRSKVIPDHCRHTPDGLVSIRFDKQPEWPRLFGLKLKLISDQLLINKQFMVIGFHSRSVTDKLKVIDIGTEIKKINENDLAMFDNVEDADYLIENVYRFNRQVTLLVKLNK